MCFLMRVKFNIGNKLFLASFNPIERLTSSGRLPNRGKEDPAIVAYIVQKFFTLLLKLNLRDYFEKGD